MTTWYLSSASNCSIVWMELSTETGSFVYTTERAFPLTWVSTTLCVVNCPLLSSWSLGAPLEPRGAPLEPPDVLSICVVVGVLIVLCGARDEGKWLLE